MEDLVTFLKRNYALEFQDLSLLMTAFTHSSYQNEMRLPKTANNERLEFLGDAALEVVISKYLFEAYPEMPEGELSKLRSQIVRSESLAEFSRRCGFDAFLLLGNGEEKSGGRNRDTNLENLFEAFLGAVLMDRGMAAVETFLARVVLPTIEARTFEAVTDYKTALQEVLQAKGDTEIVYRVVDEVGPAHDKLFVVEVVENESVLGRGEGKSKKAAEQQAAQDAFRRAHV
ncbi:MAG: ribonuclease III [Streptococcaceae bacterium]|jgi:ribonuclease-3|nr:ribonuclease III [Streptococcaceae bacterium]